jgi:hypothetical protein
MTIKIARQAHCIEALWKWLDRDHALASVTELDSHFTGSPINAGILVRELVARHHQIGKGALFAQLSRTLAALELNADYFRAARYASTIGEHVALHQSFHAMIDEFVEGSNSSSGTEEVASVLRDSALISTLPRPLAENVVSAATQDPVRVPLGLGFTELEWIIGKLYARLCARIGPESADRTLARALERARREAPGVDPRLFL